MIIERIPATLQLSLFALSISAIIAFPVRVLVAVKKDTGIDYAGKLFAILAPGARIYLGDVLAFVKHNPTTPNALHMMIGAAKLKKSLATESGKVVKASLGSLKKVMAKSEGFAKHKAQLAARRKQQQKNQHIEALAELKAYKHFLVKIMVASMADDDGTTEKLLPIIETVEAGLASKDASAVSRALAATRKQIKADAKIKKAFQLAEADLKAEKKRIAELD